MRLPKPDLSHACERRANDRKTRECPDVTPVYELGQANLRFTGNFAKPSGRTRELTAD